jgi:hypothetical protein
VNERLWEGDDNRREIDIVGDQGAFFGIGALEKRWVGAKARSPYVRGQSYRGERGCLVYALSQRE